MELHVLDAKTFGLGMVSLRC